MNSLTLLLILLVTFASSNNLTRNEKLCQACIGLNDAIKTGLDKTKHKANSYDNIGTVDSQGNRRQKISYGNSETRLTEILEEACKNNPHKPECFELTRNEKYYEPIKDWFVAGHKGEFKQAFCFSQIPNCSEKVAEKEASPASSTGSSTPGSKANLPPKSDSFVQKIVSYLPKTIQEKPFLKNFSSKLPNLPVGKYSQMARKYSQIAYTKGSFVTRKFNKQLDKLPIRSVIAMLPLPNKTATFVEKHWKLVVATLFLALLIPMYYLTCKVSRGSKGSERVRANRPVTRSSSRVSKKNE
jgi:hypothetical protein